VGSASSIVSDRLEFALFYLSTPFGSTWDERRFH